MRIFLLVVGLFASLLIGITSYFIFIHQTAEERFSILLRASLDDEFTFELNECNLKIMSETKSETNEAIGFTRRVSHLDLRVYDLKRFRLFQLENQNFLRIQKGPVKAPLLRQFYQIRKTAKETLTTELPDEAAATRHLKTAGSLTAFQFIAQYVETEDGTFVLDQAEAAPNFYRFTQAVEALPLPISFLSETKFAPGEPSAETFRVGMISIAPNIDLSIDSALDIPAAMDTVSDYARAFDCN